MIGRPAGSTDRTPHLGLLVLGVAAVVGFRAWASWRAEVPQVYADEAAYLAMARLLGGGSPWNMGEASTYGPGYSLLIAPWFALDLDPPHLYRMAIWTNTVLAGCTVVTYEALAARVTPLRRPLTIAVAAAAASLPALVLTANLAWSDNLTPLCFALLVLTLLRFLECRTPGRGLVVAVAAVAAAVTHDRFLPVVVVLLATLALVAWNDRDGRGAALLSMGATMTGVAATRLLTGLIHDRLYEPGAAADRLGEVERLLRVGPGVLSFLGQSWYLLVSTAGVAGLGVVALAIAWRRSAGEDRLPVVATAALLAAAFVPSVVFMTDRQTGHHLVYGRYNDAIAGVLVIMGLGWLLTDRHLRSRLVGVCAVALTAGASAVILGVTRGDMLDGAYNPPTVLGLMPIDRTGPREVAFITVVSLVLLAFVTFPTFWRAARPAALGVAVGLTLLGGIRGVDYMRARAMPRPEVAAGLEEFLEPGAVVAYPSTSDLGNGTFFGYPFYAPSLWLERTAGNPWEEGASLILASNDSPEIRAAGYRQVWSDPHVGAALWVAPAEPRSGGGGRR